MSENRTVAIYDTTLRDGTQGEGVSFSSLDKIRIAEKLDEFGVDYIEGGWPGSNPKDVSFFEEAKKREWKHAKIAAFGSTRRADRKVEDDPQIQTLLDAETPVVTFFGKTWLLHVTEVLRTTGEENLAMIRDTSRYLKENGKEVVYDAEHFFDGYKDDAEYALSTLRAAKEGGADIVVLCDTNGGTMPDEVAALTKHVMEELDMPAEAEGLLYYFSGGGIADFGDTYYFRTSPEEIDRMLREMKLTGSGSLGESPWMERDGWVKELLPGFSGMAEWGEIKQYSRYDEERFWFFELAHDEAKTQVIIHLGCI